MAATLWGEHARLAPRVEVLWTRELPAEARMAWEVRWDSDATALLACTERGVLSVDVNSATSPLTVVVAGSGPGVGPAGRSSPRTSTPLTFFSVHHLARPDAWLVVGGPITTVAWGRAGAPAWSGEQAMYVVSDLDARGDSLVIVGSRSRVGSQAADEAVWAWKGSLATGTKQLQPIYVRSLAHLGPREFDMCGAMQMGHVRFLADGSFALAPGVDPGIFLYRQDGVVSYVWDTEQLGIDAGCVLAGDKAALLARDLAARFAWLNSRRVIDELVPVGARLGVIVRTVKTGVVSWELVLPERGASPPVVPLPLAARSRFSFLRADVRGDRLLLLKAESGESGVETPDMPPSLTLARLSL